MNTRQRTGTQAGRLALSAMILTGLLAAAVAGIWLGRQAGTPAPAPADPVAAPATGVTGNSTAPPGPPAVDRQTQVAERHTEFSRQQTEDEAARVAATARGPAGQPPAGGAGIAEQRAEAARGQAAEASARHAAVGQERVEAARRRAAEEAARQAAIAERKAAEARRQAEEAAARQAADARSRLETVRRQAEEEAARQAAIAGQRVEAARRQATEEAARQAAISAQRAGDTRRQAEEEAARQAAVARQRVETARRRASEEAARQAAISAQRAGDTRRQAEEEAARQAAVARQRVETARRRASEEAARQAAIAEQKAEAARRQRVATLLAQAGEDIDALRLSSPPGRNALQRLNEVLALDPDNVDAQREMARIRARYVELIDTAIEQGEADRGRALLDRLAAIDADAPATLAARERLQALQGSPATAPPAASAGGGPRLAVLGVWCKPCATTIEAEEAIFVDHLETVLAQIPGVRLHSAPWAKAPAPPIARRDDRERLFSESTGGPAQPDLDAFTAIARDAGADAVLVGMMVYTGVPPYPVRVFLVDTVNGTVSKAEARIDDSDEAIREVLEQWLR